MRKDLRATKFPFKSPCQISVNPPDLAAILRRFASPGVESTAEVGRWSVALHTPPSAVINLAFCGSTVGYAFAETVCQYLEEKGEPHRRTLSTLSMSLFCSCDSSC